MKIKGATVKDWDYNTGGFPNICFYLFFDAQGNENTIGYVATDDVYNKAAYAKTKEEAIKKYNSF